MKKDIIKFEPANDFSCSNKRHEIDVFLHMNNDTYVETRTPLNAVKEFIEVIDDAIALSTNSNVIIESECILADVFTAAFNYCAIFNNINLHYMIDGKEVDSETLFEELNLGYDYVIDRIENIKKEYDNNDQELDYINEAALKDW